MAIIPKSQMTEEDIKLNYITPAIQNKGWGDSMTMETKVKITDGKIELKGNLSARKPAKKADYVLYYTYEKPIAVVEAKDNSHTVSYGLQQAMTYAQMLDVPFAYSSNGDAFFEHDFITGAEKEIPLDQFPSYDELVQRFKEGKGITESQDVIIRQPYYSSADSYRPRYYQRNAINRTVEAIANGKDRLLLVMATGTGKTYTAFQIVYRLLKSNTKKKILYLADRNNLVDQSISGDFKPLSKVIHKIDYSKDKPNTITSYQVYFALYQQLADKKSDSEDDDEADVSMERLSSLFKPDFFDLIIVDECHRGSAKKDSNWRKILEYFKGATQIGMTATPKETAEVSNIDYFGEPIYIYSLKEGIDDGFLAPFKVVNVKTNIGEGWRPTKGQRDINGNEIEDRIYTNSDFDYNIIIQDRIDEVAYAITEYLKSTNRMNRTIVFCATENHAEMMRIALVNCNQDMVKDNPDYVVRITGSDEYGKSKLSYFISANYDYPVIATTSKLLSCGTDCKTTKLIVLDQNIQSMIDFKQIIGRGTRIREDKGKLSFTIMDFRNVSRKFSDPDWDGPVEQDDDFDPNCPHSPSGGGKGGSEPPTDPKTVCVVDANGCEVHIIEKVVSIYDTNGKLLRTESITDYTKTNIREQFATLDEFISKWSDESKKKAIKELFMDKGIDITKLKEDEGFADADDFDFICHVAYDAKPLTRRERANNVKKRDFLNKYQGVAREVLENLIDTYMNEGIYEVEDMSVLKLMPFAQYGAPSKIVTYFGGKENYLSAVKELENEIYGVA